MKSVVALAALVAALLSQPVAAQLGPAGVPGLFDLVESITGPATPPPTQPPQEKARGVDCSKAKNVAQCKARQQALKKNVGNCNNMSGTKLKQCLKKLAQTDCSKTSEPLVCEQHQKAHALCKDKIGQEHRQCLRDNLAPKK